MDNIVVVFTMDGCPFCEMMKSQLIESQIDFVERNIREHEEEYKLFMEATGSEFVPAFMIINDPWIDLYDKIEPFKTKEERENYSFVYNEYFCDEYDNLNNLGYFSIEFLSCLLELFVKCEKQTQNAFMFKNLLQLVKDFCAGKRDYYQVISYSKRV